MNKTVYTLKSSYVVFMSLGLILFLTACSGGSDGADPTVVLSETVGVFFPPSDQTVTGTIVIEDTQRSNRSISPTDTDNMTLALDDGVTEIPFDSQGSFEMENIFDGNHTLFVHHEDGTITNIPFRMLSGRGLDMGTITIHDGLVESYTGFDGYLFGFIDEDDDGINDCFIDENGDGICDLTGMPFSHPFGYMDEDNDGINDRFVDSDGDGINDLTGHHYDAGYAGDHNDHGGMMDDEIQWPMPHRDHGMMGIGEDL